MALEEVLEDFEKALNRLKEAHLRTKNSSKEDYPFFLGIVRYFPVCENMGK